jgi:hypothetical protein
MKSINEILKDISQLDLTQADMKALNFVKDIEDIYNNYVTLKTEIHTQQHNKQLIETIHNLEIT